MLQDIDNEIHVYPRDIDGEMSVVVLCDTHAYLYVWQWHLPVCVYTDSYLYVWHWHLPVCVYTDSYLYVWLW